MSGCLEHACDSLERIAALWQVVHKGRVSYHCYLRNEMSEYFLHTSSFGTTCSANWSAHCSAAWETPPNSSAQPVASPCSCTACGVSPVMACMKPQQLCNADCWIRKACRHGMHWICDLDQQLPEGRRHTANLRQAHTMCLTHTCLRAVSVQQHQEMSCTIHHTSL